MWWHSEPSASCLCSVCNFAHFSTKTSRAVAIWSWQCNLKSAQVSGKQLGAVTKLPQKTAAAQTQKVPYVFVVQQNAPVRSVWHVLLNTGDANLLTWSTISFQTRGTPAVATLTNKNKLAAAKHLCFWPKPLLRDIFWKHSWMETATLFILTAATELCQLTSINNTELRGQKF